jgi:hypothetical protein
MMMRLKDKKLEEFLTQFNVEWFSQWSEIPTGQSGVYLLFCDGDFDYIGESKQIGFRLCPHGKHHKYDPEKHDAIAVIPLKENRNLRRKLETAFIKRYEPSLNETKKKRKTFIRSSLLLTPDQWAALDRLAAETGSVAPSGTRAGEPSWRSLVKRIANGEYKLVKNEKN